jgi:SAM-dependent methyltransferase
MSKPRDDAYGRFYGAKDPIHVYPVEFVVRAFLGSYPRLPREDVTFGGQRVLDLGFGDGRNLPLLQQLGFSVSGVEVTSEICEAATRRMARLGVPVDLRVGRNRQIPFDDRAFDHVVACHSCYYVDPGTTFADNLREIARVTAPGGRFVLSAPMASTYIMADAIDRGDGLMEIRRDPYGVRNGSLLQKFDTGEQLAAALAPWFEDARIGSCRNDFWGIEEHVWTAVCRRRTA